MADTTSPKEAQMARIEMDNFTFSEQCPTNWANTNGRRPSVAPDLLLQIRLFDGTTTCKREQHVNWKETTAFRVVQA